MRVFTRRTLREFWEEHKDAEKPLIVWFKITKAAKWNDITEVKQTYPHADAVGNCTVFNIGGNKYRLVTEIIYQRHKVYIKYVLTHKDYEKGEWKNECRSSSR